jgi:glycosyltransferase involved in cell wall biosynthesis
LNAVTSDLVLNLDAIICTHNPSASALNRVFDSLLHQTLSRERWGLVLVDSGSTPPLRARTDLHFPEFVRHVRVDEPGLALARMAGFKASNADIIASLDDDTELEASYLLVALEFLENNPAVSIVSGRVKGSFEVPPPEWLPEFNTLLALRDLGESVIQASAQNGKLKEYPSCSPFGVNVSRREALGVYEKRWIENPLHRSFGRRGQSLASGEDNDFVLCVLRSGRAVAYHPGMILTHIIPKRRLEREYLERLNHASSLTWVQVLALHDACPWSSIPHWTVPLRKLKAWFAYRAWAGPAERIRWRGACGHFEGRAAIRNQRA